MGMRTKWRTLAALCVAGLLTMPVATPGHSMPPQGRDSFMSSSSSSEVSPGLLPPGDAIVWYAKIVDSGVLSDSMTGNFGLVTVSASLTREVRVQNEGFASVVMDLSISGNGAAEFTLGQDACSGVTLPVGEACTFEMTFAPVSDGSKNAKVQLLPGAMGSAYVIDLSGTAASSGIEPRPNALSFGAIVIPGFTANTVTVFSTGKGTLYFPENGLSITGTNAEDFRVEAHNCGGMAYGVYTGGGCQITLYFEPLGVGERTAVLLVSSSAPGGPLQVPLTGEGLENQIEVLPSGRGLTVGWDSVSGANQYVASAVVQPPSGPSLSQAIKKKVNKKAKRKAKKKVKRQSTVRSTTAKIRVKLKPRSKFRVCVEAQGYAMRPVPVCIKGQYKGKTRKR